MKDVTIKVKFDRSAARQAAREHADDAKKMVDAIKESFAEQRKAIADSVKASLESQKATTRELADSEKAYRKQIADDAVQRARDSAKAIAEAQRASAKETMALETAQSKQKMTDGQALKAAFDSLLADEDRKKVESHKATIQRMKEGVGATQSGFGMMKDAALGAGKAVLNVVAGYATFGTAVQVLSMIGNLWESQRKDIEASATALGKQREEMLAIAALKDNPGRSTHETTAQLEFRAKTLQTAGDARNLQRGALNTGQASIMAGYIEKGSVEKGNLDHGPFEKLMEYAGAYQATNPDVSADAFGNLVGILPSLNRKANQSAEDVAAQAINLTQTFAKGSSDPGPALRQFQSNAALVAPGLFRSPEELAAVQSAFSSTAPNEAGTLSRHLLRGTVGGLTRMRGSALEGSIPQADYLNNELHANDSMGVTDIGRMIAADLKAQEAKAKGAGKAFNAQTYLTTKGYQDEESRMAVMNFASMVNSGQYDKTFGPMADPSRAPKFDDAMKPVRDFQAVDPVAMNRRGEVSGNLKDAIKGMGAPEFHKAISKIAFDKLSSEGKTYGNFEDSYGSKLWSGQIDDEVRRMLEEQGAKVGLAPSQSNPVSPIMTGGMDGWLSGTMGMGGTTGIMGGSPISRLITGTGERQQAVYDYAQQIREKGGDPVDFKAMLEQLQKQTKLAEAAEQRAISARNQPPQSLPPVGPAGVPIVSGR